MSLHMKLLQYQKEKNVIPELRRLHLNFYDYLIFGQQRSTPNCGTSTHWYVLGQQKSVMRIHAGTHVSRE